MSNISIIIQREFNERVRKKSFIITTLLMPVLMIGLMAAPALIMQFSRGDEKVIAVIDDSGQVAPKLENDEEIYALSDLLDRAAETGTLPDMPLYRVTEALETDGTAILPSLSLDRFGQTAPSGTAVFTEGKLSCFLDGGVIGGERFA